MKNIISKLIFSIFIILSISGCSQEEKKELKIGISPWPGYEPLVLAAQKGFYGDLKVRLIRYPTSTESFRAFRDGIIDIAAFTTNEVIQYAKVKDTPKIFLILDVSNGGDAILSQASIKNIDDLKGKKIGLEPSNLSEYMINRVLDFSNNISIDDVALVSLEQDKQIQAFQDKKIDALVTYNPNKSILLNKGANLLFDSSKIPYEVVDVLVTNNNLLKTRAKDLVILKSGWFKAIKYINANKKETMKIMAEYENISPQEFEKNYNEMLIPSLVDNIRMLSDQKSKLYGGVKRLKQQMVKSKQMKKDIDIYKIFDSSIAKKK